MLPLPGFAEAGFIYSLLFRPLIHGHSKYVRSPKILFDARARGIFPYLKIFIFYIYERFIS